MGKGEREGKEGKKIKGGRERKDLGKGEEGKEGVGTSVVTHT